MVIKLPTTSIFKSLSRYTALSPVSSVVMLAGSLGHQYSTVQLRPSSALQTMEKRYGMSPTTSDGATCMALPGGSF